MDYILGVDIGTTSTKAIAYDLYGKILKKKAVEYKIIIKEPGYSEQDPEEIFNAVIACISHVNKMLEDDHLIGIGFSCAMHSVIAVGKDGKPLTNCIIWADTRSEKYALELKSSGLGHKIYMNTGTPIHPMSPLCKIKWIKDNLPDVYSKTDKFISIKEYLFYKLFNVYLIDYSLASATGMFDLTSLTWNIDALNYLGINENMLSTPVSPTYKIEQVCDYREDLGIKDKVPFIIGGSDGCLANLGVGAIKQGTAALTIGTSGAVRITTKKIFVDEKERLFSYILHENMYVIGGAVNNGGIILDWFKNNFSNKVSYENLLEATSKIKAGAEGLLFLPYLMGERAPYWDANSRGVFFGININHTKYHFLRAVLEGIIYGLYTVEEALREVTGNIDVIHATGGLLRSSYMLQMVSDVFNKTIAVCESIEGSCFGAAIMVMKALGIIDNFEQVPINIKEYFHPNYTNHQIYLGNYHIFKRLYHKLKDEFMEISKLEK